MQVSIREAQAQFSELIDRVLGGEEVTVTRSGRPVARLIPISGGSRISGTAKGLVDVAEDFDAPLPPGFRPAID